MDSKHELNQALMTYKQRGLAYDDAKHVLIGAGYDPEDIDRAAESMRYADINSADMDTSLPASSNDPTANEAKRILLEDLKAKQRRIIGLDREGMTGLFTTQGRGMSIDGLGLPVGLLAAIGITGFVVIWWLSFAMHKLPDNAPIVFIVIYAAFIGLLIAYRLAILSRKVLGLTKETRSSPIVPVVMIIVIALAALFVANFLIGILRMS